MIRNLRIELLACVLLLSACGDGRQEAAEYALTAQSLAASGDFINARENIQQAISKRDDIAEYYLLLGRIELKLDRQINAFHAYKSALDLDTANPEALQSVAELGLQIGRIKDSEDAVDRLLVLNPQLTQALLTKGFIELDRGEIETAKKIAQQILQINPRDEGGVILSARSTALAGKPDDAMKIVDDAAAAIGRTDALNITALEISRAKGDLAGMKAMLSALSSKMPDNDVFAIDYANTLYKGGDTAAARNMLFRLLQKRSGDQATVSKIIDRWAEYDREPLSIDQLEIMVSKGPPPTRIALARFFLEIGNASAAQKLIKPLADSGSNEAQALYARVLGALGKDADAARLAGKVLAIDKVNGDALLSRSALAIAGRRYEAAINDSGVVVRDAPENVDGYLSLASAHIGMGNARRARLVYEQGMDRLPQNRRLHVIYAKFLTDTGDDTRARSVLRELALATPSSTHAWALVLNECDRQGDTRCATEARNRLAKAKTTFVIDDPPGFPRRRGLFGRLSPV